MNGPAPTAGDVSFSNLPMSPTASQTCLGTIGMWFSSIEACGFLVLMTRVRSSVAVTLSKFSTAGPLACLAASTVMTVLKVHAASCAVTGLPSDHLALARILKVQVSLSSDVSHDSARSGLGCRVLGSGTVRNPYIQRWID